MAIYYETTTCRACRHSPLADFLDLGQLPLVNKLFDPAQDSVEEHVPLTVSFCPACALVQLRQIVSPHALFAADYPYYSSLSETWLAHCRQNAWELIDRCKLNDRSLVLEIGSNDGYMLRNFCERGIPVLGLEPTPGPAAAAMAVGVPTRQEFFGQDLALRLADESQLADLVIANNVLAHVPDLRGLISGIQTVLKPDGVVVIEAPYLRDLVERCEFDTIYHEHMSYFSVTAVQKLLAGQGLILLDVQCLTTHGGSLRYYAARHGRPGVFVDQLLEDERQAGLEQLDYYHEFAARVKVLQRRIAEKLWSIKAEGCRIAAYGAAAKGAALLNMTGVGTEVLDYVVDRNRHKQGKRMPGVHLPIYEPERLLLDGPDYLLLLPWNLKDEIIEQQAEFARRGGRFIVPIPDCKIL